MKFINIGGLEIFKISIFDGFCSSDSGFPITGNPLFQGISKIFYSMIIASPMCTGYKIGNKALPIGNITIFSFHCINGDYPLFTKLTNINTVYKFTVRNRLTECALIKSPKFSRIGKCN